MAQKVIVHTSRRFDKDYANLPDEIQVLVDKAVALFADNPHHPGLHTKKMRGHAGIWEARVSKGLRFTFRIENGIYVLRAVGPHDIEKNP